MRGYMQRWLVASMFWERCVQPVNLLTTYCAEDQMLISWPNHHIWSGDWDLVSLLQSIAKDREVWPTLFKNSTARAIALRRLVDGPRIAEGV